LWPGLGPIFSPSPFPPVVQLTLARSPGVRSDPGGGAGGRRVDGEKIGPRPGHKSQLAPPRNTPEGARYRASPPTFSPAPPLRPLGCCRGLGGGEGAQVTYRSKNLGRPPRLHISGRGFMTGLPCPGGGPSLGVKGHFRRPPSASHPPRSVPRRRPLAGRTHEGSCIRCRPRAVRGVRSASGGGMGGPGGDLALFSSG
jgi:hypothetical protein